MMKATARKTSLENKRLRNCHYFAINPSCSHFTKLAKNPTTGWPERCKIKYTELKICGCMFKLSSKR